MPKMKSRSEFPPLGWGTFRQPQAPGWMPVQQRSFDVTVDSIIDLRRGNPSWGLPVDRPTVENELDEWKAKECVANGWNNFVTEGPGPPVLNFRPPQPLLKAVVAAGNAVKRPMLGVAAVRDWLGDGLKPVAPELSAKRAEVCVECPQNQDPNFIQKLIGAAAESVRSLIQIRDDIGAKTPFDDKLHSCQACDCALVLKVHCPIEHVRKGTAPEVMAKHRAIVTPSGKPCWVASEQ
jgi:hypothetical protein